MKFRLLAILCLLLQVTGCSFIFGDDEELPDLPTGISYSVFADPDVNLNVSGQPTPIGLQVFQLEDDSMFLDASFDELIDDYGSALGSTYVDHVDYVLKPGQFKFVELFDVEEDTKFIAVFGKYAEPNTTQWKKIIRIKPLNKRYRLMVYLGSDEAKMSIVE